MTGLPKGTGSVPLKDISPEAVESLLNSPDWQRRLEEARVQRERVLAEKARLEGPSPENLAPKRPWEREAPVPSGRPRPPVDREAAAAARADVLLPEVMRAMRAASSPSAPKEAARVVPLTQPPAPDVRKAPVAGMSPAVETAPAQGRAPAGSGLQRVSERITFGVPNAVRDARPAGSAPAASGRASLTPDLLNPAVLPPAAVPPLVAANLARRRPLPLLLAAAFATGAIIGGGAFLWFGHPAVQDTPAPVPSKAEAPATAKVAAAAPPPKAPDAPAAGAAPAPGVASASVLAPSAGPAPDSAAGTAVAATTGPVVVAGPVTDLASPAPGASDQAAIPAAIAAPGVDMVPAPLGSPAGPDGAADVLHAEGIASASPAAVSGAGLDDPLDVAFPRSDPEPARVLAPHGLSFADGIVDRLPEENALPHAPGVSADRPGTLTFAADAGEALSFPLPAASALPGRIAHPEMGKAVPDAGSGAAAITDPAVFQTAAPLPVLAGAAFPDLGIRVLKSARATDAAVNDITRKLVSDGFPKPSEKSLSLKISVSHVRFYHDGDRSAALAVAKDLGIGAQQFPPPGDAAMPGTVEIWVGTSQSQDATAGSTAKASAKSKKSASSAASKRRQAEREQVRALRDRIVQQLRNGVAP